MLLSCQLLSKGITYGKSIACCKWEIEDTLAWLACKEEITHMLPYICVDCKENDGTVSLPFKTTVSVHFIFYMSILNTSCVHFIF